MKALILYAALLACANASARPVVIEPVQDFNLWPGSVALTGDEAIITTSRFLEFDDEGEEQVMLVASLYRRATNGQWNLVRDLVGEQHIWYETQSSVAMSASVAAVRLPSGFHLFERTASGWVEGVLDIPRPLGTIVEVSSNRVLVAEAGGCAAEAAVLERGANGHWNISARLPAPPGSCVFTAALGDAGAAIISAPNAPNARPDALRIFDRAGSTWTLAATFPPVDAGTQLYGPALAMHDGLVLVSGSDKGMHVYRRGSGGWAKTGIQPLPDGYDGAGHFSYSIEITDDFVLAVGYSNGRRTGVGYLFQQGPNQSLEYVANLVVPGSNGLSTASIDGHYVLGTPSASYLIAYDLPASFATAPVVQDDFESGPGPWQVLPGSQFSIVPNGDSHAWRQSSLAGNAGAVYDADRTNQAISAEITPRAFNGQDRWIGLVTRYTDEQNYYYLTLRDGDGPQLVIRRMLNGVWSDLARTTFGGWVPGQRQRVTFQSSGSQHQVFIDDRLMVIAFDSTHAHGKAGVRMYKASADFDNVVVTPGPFTYLAHVGPETVGGSWTSALSGGPTPRAQQHSLDGEARALFGAVVEDSMVEVSLRVDEFGASGSPWVGLMSRYVDTGNYYYVTFRKSNELSLRKLTNGVITVLGTVNLPVPAQAQYRVRFETVGDKLRVWVDNALKLERSGAQSRAGRVGFMTYRARATFDGYLGYMP